MCLPVFSFPIHPSVSFWVNEMAYNLPTGLAKAAQQVLSKPTELIRNWLTLAKTPPLFVQGEEEIAESHVAYSFAQFLNLLTTTIILPSASTLKKPPSDAACLVTLHVDDIHDISITWHSVLLW